MFIFDLDEKQSSTKIVNFHLESSRITFSTVIDISET